MRTARIALLLALAGASGCTFDATRLTSTPAPSQRESPPVEASQAVVEVYADPATPPVEVEWTRRSVETFASDLRKTGLFKDVLMGRGHPEAALGFAVRDAGGVGRCGTPHALSAITLGLWHGSTPYHQTYDFTVVAPEGGRLDVKKEYEGKTLSGLLALGLRASSSWSAPSQEGSSAVVVEALRRDLLAETGLWALLREQSAAASTPSPRAP